MTGSTTGSTGQVGRLAVVDALRGLAVCGILLANVHFLDGWQYLSPGSRATLPLAAADGPTIAALRVLVEGKFYSLFSLLFGLGFGLMLTRAGAEPGPFLSAWRRRMAVLLAIGLVHGLFVWLGDILALYALLGLLLPLFRRFGQRRLLAWAGVLLLLPVVQYVLMMAMLGQQPESPAQAAERHAFMEGLVALMADGPRLQALQTNAVGYLAGRWPDLLFTGRPFKVLAMFLLGLWLARRGVAVAPQEQGPWLRRVLVWCLLVGLPGNGMLAWLMAQDAFYALQPPGLLQAAVYAVAVPALAAAWAAGFALLFVQPRARRWLLFLVPLGRLALSNYLAHSLLGVAAFTVFGLGLAGRFSALAGVLYALAVLAVLAAASRAWLARFGQGPVERLWRRLARGPAPARGALSRG